MARRSSRLLVAAAALLVGSAALAQQADRPHTEALAGRAAERIRALHREAEALATQEKTLLGELRKLDLDRRIKAEELRQFDSDSAGIERELAAANERLIKLEQDDLTRRPDLRARLVEIYKRGQGRYLRLLLSTTDARRIGEASRTVAALARLDRDRIAAHQRTVADLRSTRAGLEQRRQQLSALRAQAQRAQADLERAARARDSLIRDIDRRRDLNAQFAGELQASQQKLQIALRALATGAAVEPAVLPLRPFRGDLDWPVTGTVRRRFARSAASDTAASNGIEIDAAEGAPVSAIHEATVAFADQFAGFGNLVILDHGSQAFSLYGYLLDISVKKGARIERGQAVGTVGTSPTGPVGLYFELRVDGQPLDPLQWLRKK